MPRSIKKKASAEGDESINIDKDTARQRDNDPKEFGKHWFKLYFNK